VAAGQCWPGNRNDVIVARHSVAQLLDVHVVFGDGAYRGIASITTPRRDNTGRIIRDDHYRAHRRIRARRARHHAAQGLADIAAMPPPPRRHQPSLHIIAGLWDLKIRNQLQVAS
jgi:hypothetical protein